MAEPHENPFIDWKVVARGRWVIGDLHEFSAGWLCDDSSPAEPQNLGAGAAEYAVVAVEGAGGDRTLDTPPVVIHFPRAVAPMDPPSGARIGIFLEFVVGADGVVRDVKAADTSNEAFAAAAVKAVASWQFKPGIKAGKPVSARMVVPIFFGGAAR